MQTRHVMERLIYSLGGVELFNEQVPGCLVLAMSASCDGNGSDTKRTGDDTERTIDDVEKTKPSWEGLGSGLGSNSSCSNSIISSDGHEG